MSDSQTLGDCRGHRFAPTLLDLPGGRYWGLNLDKLSRLKEDHLDILKIDPDLAN